MKNSRFGFEKFIEVLKKEYIPPIIEDFEEIHFFCTDKFKTRFNNRLVRIDSENFMYIYPINLKESNLIERFDLENYERYDYFSELEFEMFCVSAKENKLSFKIN